MADDAEQERKAKAERAKKLVSRFDRRRDSFAADLRLQRATVSSSEEEEESSGGGGCGGGW